MIGKDGSGLIESIGAEVTDFSVGDRVYFCGTSTGAYAQYCLADVSNVFALPDNTTFSQGACLGVPAFTAYRALFKKARVKPGEVILIHGASGGVGLMVTQIAHAFGMIVIGTAGTDIGLQVLLTFFCDPNIN